jgi:hypothetical protein
VICLLLATTPALATPLEAFPLRAPVTLPEGPVRLYVPLGLRSPADPDDGTDLLLVNGQGDEIPFLRVEGDARRFVPVAADVAPTDEPTSFLVTPAERVDRVEVSLPRGVVTAQVSARVGADLVAGPTRVWGTPNGEQAIVELPALTGPFTLVVVPRREGRLDGVTPGLRWFRAEGLAVPTEAFDVAVGEPRVQENGWARWVVRFERPVPLDALSLHTGERNLSREAGLEWLALHDPGTTLGREYVPTPTRTLTVRRNGDERVVEDLRLPAPSSSLPGDALLVLVSADGQPVPALSGATAEVRGVELYVPEPGPGPHTLYAGAPRGTAPRWDVGEARELVDAGAPRVAPDATERNPRFVPFEERAELVGPGADLEPTTFALERDVTGEGLVRIPLPPEVRATARPDLGDVRLVDRDRNQLPYLVRRANREQTLAPVTLEVDERRGETRLRVHLPEDNLPSVTLALATDATMFSRHVQVRASRPDRVLRAVRWEATGAAARLVVELPGPVPDDLVLIVDNGDNGPLAVSGLEAWTDGTELLAVLPADGARLWYGAPGLAGPSYDLAALDSRWRAELLTRAATEASVGEPRRTVAAGLRWFDRVLVGVALAVFGVGVLLLLLDLLRKLPAAAPPAEPGPPEPESPAPPVVG